jgi:hypothetical protein
MYVQFSRSFKRLDFMPNSNCEFYQSKVEILNYVIFGNGIHMDPCKVQTIVDWVILTSLPTIIQ